ncbi:MAG TPA: anaerobic glycerol-3-phosphate dehydrogenase subunit GlpB [Methylomirabilota bacterium]|nr:anaerobic glycerol-3-phosphate dehydrogenase subunit GlpB [Methylomirabilota bacterium]
MPQADVVVVGAGLAGMTAAIALADAGARVEVVARGHAATHWTAGGIDVAAPRGSETSAKGVKRLARQDRHPYAILGEGLPAALTGLRSVLATEGLDFHGDLADPLCAIPTAIGGTRRAAILPTAQANALVQWQSSERLVVCGPAGFKDFWPDAIAASLRRPAVWGSEADPDASPSRIDAIVVELPGLAGRHNLSGLDLARFFDDPRWRADALERIARAVDRSGAQRGGGRIALPAALGLADHAAAFDEASRILPLAPFEMPLVSPSVPGLRLYAALRAALRRRGGRIAIGEPVEGIAFEKRRVTSVTMAAAVRDRVIRTEGVVLATGGIAGGGLIGRSDGRLVEPLLDLPVEAPPAENWLAADPFDPAGHPLEAAGIRTDSSLRPLDAKGKVVLENVAIVGSLLAGQHYLVERCGDGVAIASGHLAATTLAPKASVSVESRRAPAAAKDTVGRQRAGTRR